MATGLAGNRPRAHRRITALDGEAAHPRPDELVVEEPLEVRLRGDDGNRDRLATTMRTPGADLQLAAGLCVSEGVVGHEPTAVRRIAPCADADIDPQARDNVVTVDLAGPLPDLAGPTRRGTMTSACGVCGTRALEDLEVAGMRPPAPGPWLDAATLYQLPERLRAAQRVFARTGGLHAAGLFSAEAVTVRVGEDVGRHNAVDKVVGWALQHGRLPLTGYVLLVSGRIGFEIVQKALAAGVPVVAGISAPSSLAVDLAERFSMTVVGFLRGGRGNVYCGAPRIADVAGGER
jgi:FdhD protein